MAGSIAVTLEVPEGPLRQALQGLLESDEEFTLQAPAQGADVELVVLELDTLNPQGTFARTAALKKRDHPPDVFLTAAQPDPKLLIEALRAGVTEFIKQPLDPVEVTRALDRVRERVAVQSSGQPRRRGKITCVVGGKAGVGVTTVAVNVAAGILQLHPKAAVALVDLNLRGGDVPALLDLNPVRGLQDIDSDLSRLDETFLGSILTTHESGLSVLPLGDVDLGGGYITSECVESTFSLMRTMFDHIVVDCGHVIDVATQAALTTSQLVMMVATVTIPVVRRSKRLLDQVRAMAESEEGRELGLVVSKYAPSDEGIMANAQHVLGQDPMAVIPFDHDLACRGLNEGNPIVKIAPRKELGKAYLAMAAEITEAETTVKSPSVLGGVLKSLGSRWSRGVPAVSLTN